MKVTLSVIKADIGSIGGHIQPSARLVETVREKVAEGGKGLLLDTYIGFTGDDVAILMSHAGGPASHSHACRAESEASVHAPCSWKTTSAP